jgi:hypothetical protein
MIEYKTETEARAAVEQQMRKYPDARCDEVHVDSLTTHDWYVFITYGKRLLWKCKWSSPIIRFK